MSSVPINNEQIFVDVLSDAGTIQVQSYPISELQSILGAHFQPQTIVIQSQATVSQPQSITSQPQSIILQPIVSQSQPQPVQSQSELRLSQPEEAAVSESQLPSQQTQSQPILEELRSIEVKIEGLQPDPQPSKTVGLNKKKTRLRCTFDPSCSMTFESEERLLYHVRRHRGENAFQCEFCEYSTYNKGLYDEHVRIHKGIKPFKCSFCPYRSVSKKNTKKHELIHSPNNPRKCDQCEFVARHVTSLAAHKKNVHEGKTEKDETTKHSENMDTPSGNDGEADNFVKCDDNEENTIAASVNNSGIIHKKCNVCGKYFPSTELQNHKLQVHGVEDNSLVVQVNKCPVMHRSCPICGEFYPTTELQNHTLQMHSEAIKLPVVQEKSTPDKDKKIKKKYKHKHIFKCALCEWSSPNNNKRILLHLIHHPNQNVDPDMVDVSVLRKYGIMK